MNERSEQPCPKTSGGGHVWKVFGNPGTKATYYRCFACGVMGDQLDGEWVEENGRFTFKEA